MPSTKYPDARSIGSAALDRTYELLNLAVADAWRSYHEVAADPPPVRHEDSSYACALWDDYDARLAMYEDRVRSARTRYERAVEAVYAFCAGQTDVLVLLNGIDVVGTKYYREPGTYEPRRA